MLSTSNQIKIYIPFGVVQIVVESFQIQSSAVFVWRGAEDIPHIYLYRKHQPPIGELVFLMCENLNLCWGVGCLVTRTGENTQH